jgi:hypothetical protein
MVVNSALCILTPCSPAVWVRTHELIITWAYSGKIQRVLTSLGENSVFLKKLCHYLVLFFFYVLFAVCYTVSTSC